MPKQKKCDIYYPNCIQDGVCYFPSFVLDKGCLVYTKDIKPKCVLRNTVKRGTIPKSTKGETKRSKKNVSKLNSQVI